MERPVTVYRFYAANDELLYVGISNNPPARFRQHTEHAGWWTDAVRVDLTHYATEQAARAAELQAIRIEHPKYNIAGRIVERQLPLINPRSAVMRRRVTFTPSQLANAMRKSVWIPGEKIARDEKVV